MLCQIFISYRRSDGIYPSYMLASDLSDNGFNVFYDKISLRSGPFPPQIENHIKNCNDFIMIVTKDYFADRIFNSDDWVLREITLALQHNKNIIPYIIDDSFPSQDHLPIEINEIAEYQRFHQTDITLFHQNNYKLINEYLVSKPLAESIEYGAKNRTSIYDANYGDELVRLQLQSNATLSIDLDIFGKILRNKRNLTVLDVGCAHGFVGQSRFKNNKFIKVFGIDKDTHCIEYALKNFSDDKFKYSVIDVEDSQFETELALMMKNEGVSKFDVIFAALVVHHLNDPGKFIRRLRNFLSPNGVLIIRGSDDGSKISSETDLLNEIIRETSSTRGVSNRFLGRELYSLVVNNGYNSVQIFTAATETSKMTFEEKQSLFLQAFSYRINTAKKQLELNYNEENLYKFKNLERLLAMFESKFYKRDFWYCHHHYIAIAKI